MGDEAEPELQKLWTSDNAVNRARALWLLAKQQGRAEHYVRLAISDSNPQIRIVGLRLARQLKMPVEAVVAQLATDQDAAVRRECAVALHNLRSDRVPELWTQLAQSYDGQDRWMLEALGIAAEGNWDACLATWLKAVGDPLQSDATRDIVWRSRAKGSAQLLVSLIQHPDTPETEKPRYFRALDFLDGPEKEEALQTLLLQ
jgi:hypothetical protein